MSLRRAGILLGMIAAAALPAAARACEPMPPDWVPPPLEEQARSTFDRWTEIVYGVVMGDTVDGKVPFKVLHVYKGSLKAGALMTFRSEVPPCLYTTFDWKGRYGIIGFDRNDPITRFLNGHHVEMMFEKGWIRRASPKPASRR